MARPVPRSKTAAAHAAGRALRVEGFVDGFIPGRLPDPARHDKPEPPQQGRFGLISGCHPLTRRAEPFIISIHLPSASSIFEVMAISSADLNS